MSEIIIIRFLPEEENITWKSRKPHEINIKKNIQENKVENQVVKTSLIEEKKIEKKKTPEFSAYRVQKRTLER